MIGVRTGRTLVDPLLQAGTVRLVLRPRLGEPFHEPKTDIADNILSRCFHSRFQLVLYHELRDRVVHERERSAAWLGKTRSQRQLTAQPTLRTIHNDLPKYSGDHTENAASKTLQFLGSNENEKETLHSKEKQ